MSFEGGKYQNDIFFSYSHGTPAHGENETDLKRWTHAFVRKLDLHDTAGLVRYAIRRGLIEI